MHLPICLFLYFCLVLAMFVVWHRQLPFIKPENIETLNMPSSINNMTWYSTFNQNVDCSYCFIALACHLFCMRYNERATPWNSICNCLKCIIKNEFHWDCVCVGLANMAVVDALHLKIRYKLYCLVCSVSKVALLPSWKLHLIENSWFRVHIEEDENRLKDVYLMPWYGAMRTKVSFTCSMVVQLLSEHISIGWCQCIHFSKGEPFPIELFLWFDCYIACWNFQAFRFLLLFTFCS